MAVVGAPDPLKSRLALSKRVAEPSSLTMRERPTILIYSNYFRYDVALRDGSDCEYRQVRLLAP